MKNFILSVICLSIISSVVYAIPPMLRLSLFEAKEGIKYMARRNINTLRSTSGYKPENQSPTFSYLHLPKKVEFLDADHEIFIPASPNKQFAKISPPDIKKENDHTVGVDLKKK